MYKKLINLKKHAGFMRYFRNTSWMFAEQMLRMVAGLFVGIWVARFLGPEQFGVYSYALAFTSIFSVIAKLGLDGIVVRDLVNEPEKRDAYLGTAFWLKFAGGVLTLGIIVIATIFTNNDQTTNLYILIIASGIIFQSFEVVDFYFQSQVLAKFVSICKVTQLLLSSLLKLFLIYKSADLFWFVLVSLIDQAILALSLYMAYWFQKPIAFFRYFNWELAKQLLHHSLPMLISGFVLMLQARVDQLMLKEMVGNTELGYYSSALKLIEVFCFIPMIITNSLFPAILNAKKKSVELYEIRLFNLYRLMMFLFVCVAIPIYFFGNEIVIFVYNATYASAGELFSLMAIRLFFTNYGVVRSAYLVSENLMKFSMISMVFGALVNVILNYLWIPDYHAKGAIWAAIISFYVTTFLMDYFYNKTKRNFNMMIRSFFIINFRA